MIERNESYKGFVISWIEPPLTSASWTANIASESRELQDKIGPSAEVIDAPTRHEMVAAAKRFIDNL